MGKDDLTWLRISYVVFALILGYTSMKAMGTLGLESGWGQKFSWYPAASMVAAVLCGVLGTWWLARDKERNDYFLHSIGEVRRVTWPSFIDTRRMTIVVCVVVGIFSLILSVFDYVWGEALKLLLAR